MACVCHPQTFTTDFDLDFLRSLFSMTFPDAKGVMKHYRHFIDKLADFIENKFTQCILLEINKRKTLMEVLEKTEGGQCGDSGKNKRLPPPK